MAIPVLPATAPFTPVQRAWLNGFFAGVLGQDTSGGIAMSAPVQAMPDPIHQVAVAELEETFPWRDPTLSIDERLALAAGRPLEHQLMAAMAQLDCGNCGYLCKTYAQAIANGDERDLMKCTPGGKETARKLKELMARAAG